MSKNKIISCRLCGDKKLNTIVNFGNIALGNNLQTSLSRSKNASRYDLIVKNCNSCNHFQLSVSINPKILYKTNYTYLTGISETFKRHFQEYINWVENKTKLKIKKINVLDIGSNDGTCLSYFRNKGANVLGVDPAQMPSKIANNNGIRTINKFFDQKVANQILKKYGCFDFITSHNVLAHIEDINSIFVSAYKCLRTDGFFCFEVGYFVEVVKKNLFDTIYHEHLDYHHANPLCKFLNKIGFSVINLSKNSIQGGSLRVLCKKTNNIFNTKQVKNFLLNEKKSLLYNKTYLKSWRKKIKRDMLIFGNLVKKFPKKDYLKVGYGSPTKAVLLIKLANLSGKDIEYVIEDNKLKINRFLPNSGIQIKSFSNNNIKKPLIVCVFAWNFFGEIVNKIKNTLPPKSVILCPLPKIKIIKI